MTKLIAAPLATIALAVPSVAAAPQFQGTAPIAYMEDLSSGAVLYQRDADRRIPPASMAKMMTVYVAFDMIKRGELKLDQTMPVRPETWQRWHGPAAGSTMFLSTGENVSVENLLKGIVTLSGNDACVVLAEGISGTEQTFTDRMNQQAKKIGLNNSHFGTSNGWPDNGVTYVTARDLAHLASATIRDFPDLYKRFYSLRSFTWGKTLGAGADITQANRDPLLGRVAGADGLKTGHTDEAGYGFTGSAEQNGRRLVMVVAGRGVRALHGLGLSCLAGEAGRRSGQAGFDRRGADGQFQHRRPRRTKAADGDTAVGRGAADERQGRLRRPGARADQGRPAYRGSGGAVARHARTAPAAGRCGGCIRSRLLWPRLGGADVALRLIHRR
jgi:hypothetical protein